MQRALRRLRDGMTALVLGRALNIRYPQRWTEDR